MPTEREREYYRMGFLDGRNEEVMASNVRASRRYKAKQAKPKRKLSAWQKYIKNKRNHIKYRDGKLNLKKMGVQFRKKKRR